MVEMTELANILAAATQDSLVLLDEVGRGTSTFDGLSIAWAISEYLHNSIKCKAVFATHYHQLTQLEGVLPGVRNYSIAVKEEKGKYNIPAYSCAGGDRQELWRTRCSPGRCA